MSTGVYSLSLFDAVLTDRQDIALLLHDLPQDAEELQVRALAASGDYFETLAARLEQIASTIPTRSGEQHQLQEIIGQLLYLQRSHHIVRKTPPDHRSL